MGTLVPRDGKLLVLINGAYGKRIALACSTLGRAVATHEWAENELVSPAGVAAALAEHSDATHVAVVHSETTSGVLNPLSEIARLVAGSGKKLLVDAMSSFGGVPIDACDVPFDALMASANKCLEGVPGMAFALVRRDALAQCAGNSHSVSLDLHAQHLGFERNGQWRFTPPCHVVAALHTALQQHESDGGVAARFRAYSANRDALIAGMSALGFVPYLSAECQSPIIVTFLMPTQKEFDFDVSAAVDDDRCVRVWLLTFFFFCWQIFYDKMRVAGFVLYPGKTTQVPSFRVGCIGAINVAVIEAAVAAAKRILDELHCVLK